MLEVLRSTGARPRWGAAGPRKIADTRAQHITERPDPPCFSLGRLLLSRPATEPQPGCRGVGVWSLAEFIFDSGQGSDGGGPRVPAGCQGRVA